MKKKINEMELRLPAVGINESLARSVISAFAAELNPTVEELGDLRLATSEAVTNCIVHAYKGRGEEDPSYIYISARLYDTREIVLEIKDTGCGIEDTDKARKPYFSTGEPGERCGMGFLVMESFTDYLGVESKPGEGTRVIMRKKFDP